MNGNFYVVSNVGPKVDCATDMCSSGRIIHAVQISCWWSVLTYDLLQLLNK